MIKVGKIPCCVNGLTLCTTQTMVCYVNTYQNFSVTDLVFENQEGRKEKIAVVWAQCSTTVF